MGIERDDWDILRSEGEGFGTVNYDMMSEDEREAQELRIFLEKVVDGFKKNDGLLGVEEASIVVLSEMDGKDKSALLEIAKKHFIPSICHLHINNIVNDENYIEDIAEGEPNEGSIIDYALNESNLGRFLILEGAEGLRAHIKETVGAKKWEEIEDFEMKRIFDEDRWHRGGASG